MGGGRTHFEKTDWTSMDSLNQGEEEESYAKEMGAGEGGVVCRPRCNLTPRATSQGLGNWWQQVSLGAG